MWQDIAPEPPKYDSCIEIDSITHSDRLAPDSSYSDPESLIVAILICTNPSRPATSIAVTTCWCFAFASALIVNGSELSPPDILCSALRMVSARLLMSSRPLTISADANAKHQHVVTAMDVAGRLGFVQINIATINDSGSE